MKAGDQGKLPSYGSAPLDPLLREGGIAGR